MEGGEEGRGESRGEIRGWRYDIGSIGCQTFWLVKKTKEQIPDGLTERRTCRDVRTDSLVETEGFIRDGIEKQNNKAKRGKESAECIIELRCENERKWD